MRSRKATKWRCPTGECKPASVWIKADRLHLLIPRETPRWTALYRRRAAVEREFGRLKNEWALCHHFAFVAWIGCGFTPT
jgi:transposase